MATSKHAAPAKAGKATPHSKKAASVKPRRRLVNPWAVVRFSLTASIWIGVAALAVLGAVAYTLPPVDGANAVTRKPSIQVVAADGTELASVGDLYGEEIKLDELPAYVPAAVIAIEDRRFYEHSGLDWRGLARAMVSNIRAGGIVQGGSTITQQVAKNLFLSNDRTLWRKAQELLLAFWLEQRFTKDQILTLYLNRVYLGSGAFGYEAAAQLYYGRPARQLTLHQAAVLAGALKAPSRANPFSDAEAANARAGVVLSAMVDTGALTSGQAADAKKTGARSDVARSAGARPGRYFTDWIMTQLDSYVGPVDRDLVVYTTLDLNVQRSAERHLARALTGTGANRRIGEGAVVVLSGDGAVRAMVGGRDYTKSQFNRATQAKRQPGSAFKPVVYLAALESGFIPDDVMEDTPVTIDGWRPENFSNEYAGEITLTEALAGSVNTVAVKVAKATGIPKVREAAAKLGLGRDLPEDLTIALGTTETTLLDLTAAYGPLANGGAPVFPFGIDVIEDRSGAVVYRRQSSGAAPVLSDATVGQMNEMMEAVITGGTGKAANIGRPAGGKTGTSQGYRDAWFIGYTPDYVAGVWMGNDSGLGMAGVTGGGLPAQVWAAVMTDAHRGLAPKPLPGSREPENGPVARFFQRLVGGG